VPNPLTGSNRQTTLAEDLERARKVPERIWLGALWHIEVGDLAHLVRQPDCHACGAGRTEGGVTAVPH
jgi:hypothetical protein